MHYIVSVKFVCIYGIIWRIKVLVNHAKNRVIGTLKEGQQLFNPFNASCSKLLLFEGFSAILVWPTIFNFWHSRTPALSPERQSARMSKIKNGWLDRYGRV